MRSITDIVRKFKQSWTEELSPRSIEQACRDAGMAWHDSLLNPITTIQVFFLQVLHGNTACEHLSHLAGIPFTAAAYCKARMRIELDSLILLLKRSVAPLHQEPFDTACWLGHRVFHVDGSSFSMPDTPELQTRFGQPGQQKPGCGFPVAHWLVMMHAGTGMITKMLAAPRRYERTTCRKPSSCIRSFCLTTSWSPIEGFAPIRIWRCYYSVAYTVCCVSINGQSLTLRPAALMRFLDEAKQAPRRACPDLVGSNNWPRPIRSSRGLSQWRSHVG